LGFCLCLIVGQREEEKKKNGFFLLSFFRRKAEWEEVLHVVGVDTRKRREKEEKGGRGETRTWTK
jgi:hypothetical protein